MFPINALDSHLFIFCGFSPWNRFRPVKIRFDRITFPVFLYFIKFIASVCRISKTFTNNRIAHPIYKLFVFGHGNLRLIHPERLHRYFFCRYGSPPKRILFFGAHLQRTSFYQHHAIRGGFVPCRSTDTCHLSARCAGASSYHASHTRRKQSDQQRHCYTVFTSHSFLHNYKIRILLCLFLLFLNKLISIA